MNKLLLLFLILNWLFAPTLTHARVTPDDIYQAKRTQFQKQLESVKDQDKREQVKKADRLLSETNQRVSARFEEDVVKMAAIMEELKVRLNIGGQPTVVAFGQGKTPIENADYWVNYAQEAVAFQKIQDYTPKIWGETSLVGATTASKNRLRGDLGGLRGKVVQAKLKVSEALKYAR